MASGFFESWRRGDSGRLGCKGRLQSCQYENGDPGKREDGIRSFIRRRYAMRALTCSMAVCVLLSAWAFGQTTAQRKPPHPAGTGRNQYTANLSDALGHEPPYTAYGAERWRTVDTSKDPTGFCLPPGPSRVLTSPFPFVILQQEDRIALLFEYQ